MNITSTDAILLNALQENARIGLESLAELTGLSTATIQRRVKRMKDNGTISQEVVLIDPASVGQTMTFIVMVELERERLSQIEEFTRRATSEAQVQQCYYITGEADFCLVCTAQNMDDYEALTHRLFFENTNVRRFRTSVVMSRKKAGMTVAIATD